MLNIQFRNIGCMNSNRKLLDIHLTLSKSKNASFISSIKSIEMFLSLTNETNSRFSVSLKSGMSSPSIIFPVFLFLLFSFPLKFVLWNSALSSWKPLKSFIFLSIEILSSSQNSKSSFPFLCFRLSAFP